MELRMPKGEFRSSPELEELIVAKQFTLKPHEWDSLPVDERERMIAASRDQIDMERIAGMSDQEKARLGGTGGWVRLKAERMKQNA